MDVRDLAPALLAIGALLDAANETLGGNPKAVSVHVRALEAGSFSVDLELVENLYRRGIALLTGQEVDGALKLKELVLFGAVGLVWLVRRLRGGRPDQIERLEGGVTRLTKDGESFDVPMEVLRLYQSVPVRSALQDVVATPLARDGIDTLVIADRLNRLVIEAAEAGYFRLPTMPDQTLADDLVDRSFSIISLAFKEDNKWRLYDGQNQIAATINDQEFLAGFERNDIRFAKGDILVCSVRFIQRQTAKGLVGEYTIERVKEHREAPRQIALGFEA